MSHVERRKREKEELRERIMQASIQIAADEGWPSLTIRKIADRIEYTPPIVYEHFKNKEDLIRELIYKGFRLLKDEFEKAQKDSGDPKAFLHKLSLVHWDFAATHVQLYKLMFSPERPTPSKEMIFNRNLLESTFHKLTNSEEEVEEVATYWATLTHGAIWMLLIKPPMPHLVGKNMRALYTKIIDRFIGSL